MALAWKHSLILAGCGDPGAHKGFWLPSSLLCRRTLEDQRCWKTSPGPAAPGQTGPREAEESRTPKVADVGAINKAQGTDLSRWDPLPTKSWVGSSSSTQGTVQELVALLLEGLGVPVVILPLWVTKKSTFKWETLYFSVFLMHPPSKPLSLCCKKYRIETSIRIQSSLLKGTGILNLCFSIFFQECRFLVEL